MRLDRVRMIVPLIGGGVKRADSVLFEPGGGARAEVWPRYVARVSDSSRTSRQTRSRPESLAW